VKLIDRFRRDYTLRFVLSARHEKYAADAIGDVGVRMPDAAAAVMVAMIVMADMHPFWI
jgi:hypothetical protein